MDLTERQIRAHDALLNRFLGYVVGSLAGFLPLFEFAVQSQSRGSLLLPGPISILFVFVGSAVTVLLTGAALVSFRQAIGLERLLAIEPAQVDEKLGKGAIAVRVVHALYEKGLARGGQVADWFVDCVLLTVLALTLAIDLTLPWRSSSATMSTLDGALLVSTLAAFVAAFVGAWFGFWLSEQSAARARAAETRRRARIAAATATGNVRMMVVSAANLPLDPGKITNPDVDLALYHPEDSTLLEIVRALAGLPEPTNSRFQELFTLYASLLTSTEMVRKIAHSLRMEAVSTGDSPDPDRFVERRWLPRDGEKPQLVAAWKALDLARTRFQEGLEPLSAELAALTLPSPDDA